MGKGIGTGGEDPAVYTDVIIEAMENINSNWSFLSSFLVGVSLNP